MSVSIMIHSHGMYGTTFWENARCGKQYGAVAASRRWYCTLPCVFPRRGLLGSTHLELGWRSDSAVVRSFFIARR
jgi:hypothetical protein